MKVKGSYRSGFTIPSAEETQWRKIAERNKKSFQKPRPFLSDLLIDRSNNFNLIRMLMALAVLYNHSFVLFDNDGYQDVVMYVFSNFDAGSLGVCVFFFISGMLLSNSFYNTGSRLKFVIKRIFRLLPALAVCLLFIIFFIGPFSSNLSSKDYFLSRDTYRLLYDIFLSNEVFIFDIPGSFSTNKVPGIVNGSLWTLPFELVCYIFMFLFLCVITYFNAAKQSIQKKLFIIVLVAFFSFYVLNGNYLISRFVSLITGFQDLSSAFNSIRLFIFFFTGVALYHLRKLIPLRKDVLAGMIILLILSSSTNWKEFQFVAEMITIVYATLIIAHTKWLKRFNHQMDPSYGIYLYAWPVQQLLAYYFILTAYESMLLSVPIVTMLGLVSYIYVERPAIKSVSLFYRYLHKYEKKVGDRFSA